MVSIKQFLPPVIGHRGASGLAPENTMASFVLAAQMRIPWVEFDVMLAGTGEAVIFHDETLERTTNGHGFVHESPLSYLRSLDAGGWYAPRFSGERIPLYAEILQFMHHTSMAANVELKALPGLEEDLVKQVLLETQKECYALDSSQILFSSFSLLTLQLLRQYAPHCHVGLLFHEWDENWRYWAEELNPLSLHFFEELLTAERMNEVKAKDKIVLSYTVNDPARASELYHFGVDAVFSDFPDRLIKVESCKT